VSFSTGNEYSANDVRKNCQRGKTIVSRRNVRYWGRRRPRRREEGSVEVCYVRPVRFDGWPAHPYPSLSDVGRHVRVYRRLAPWSTAESTVTPSVGNQHSGDLTEASRVADVLGGPALHVVPVFPTTSRLLLSRKIAIIMAACHSCGELRLLCFRPHR